MYVESHSRRLLEHVVLGIARYFERRFVLGFGASWSHWEYWNPIYDT